jgi:hypothetical protein
LDVGAWHQIRIMIPKLCQHHYCRKHFATFLFRYVYYNNPLLFQVSNLSIWCKSHSWLYTMQSALVLVCILLCAWTFSNCEAWTYFKVFEFVLHFGYLQIINVINLSVVVMWGFSLFSLICYAYLCLYGACI